MEEVTGRRVTTVAALLLSGAPGIPWLPRVLPPAGPAAAHNSLTGSDPRDGARLEAAPATVRLTLLARPDPTTTRVTVTGPDNISATARKPSYSGSRGRLRLGPVRAVAGPGPRVAGSGSDPDRVRPATRTAAIRHCAR
ncbi:copper resistance protein CopC [Plantactinospora sp. S1510]|uniref:Copper resistance protein CopC n=1 Tax=Plantactinospora alkalitolerans TaxID=2789879 RepID=A0ABS0H258_9ACTN|nr:copper resistance protein CopC [Plantactinospora alkalitolerans]MBF9132542.1 copper resistance protein CopC [Plantactinospora alkalitolerans]